MKTDWVAPSAPIDIKYATDEERIRVLWEYLDAQQKALADLQYALETTWPEIRVKMNTDDLLTEILDVDGAGSGIDADLLDGEEASAFADASHTHAASDVDSGTFADARIAESNVTQHEAAVDHDALTNTHNLTTDIDHDTLTGFVSQEHIRWDQTGAEDVHDDRIGSSAVTQHEGSITHDNLSGVAANEHQTIIIDTFANRPAAGTAGRLFWDTTNNVLQYDDGVAWVTVVSVLGPKSSVDIDGGAIDGVTIGANAAVDVTAQDVTAEGDFLIGGSGQWGLFGASATGQGAAVTNAETGHSLSGTYTASEIEGALNALGSDINNILARLRTPGIIAT